MDQAVDELHAHLALFGRRLRLRDGWLLAQGWLWVACLGAVLIQLAGRVWPVERLWLWTLVPPAAWPLIVIGISRLRSFPSMRVARRVDAELGLKERLATALALEGGEVGRLGAWMGQPSLLALQRQDALAVAQAVDPARAFGLHWLRRPLLLALALAAATASLALLPSPMDAVLAERAVVSQAAEEQAEQIEALREEIEKAQELTPEAREELLRQLAEAAQQLRANPGDREEALADLSKVEEALRRRLDPNAAARQAAMRALAAQLHALAKAEANEQGDASGTAEALGKLAQLLAEMSDAERAALARSLARMAAQAAQVGDGDLAQALASLAQAAQSGEGETMAQAAQAAAEAIRQVEGELADQVALGRAVSQLSAGRQAIARAGQGQVMAQVQGQGQSQNQGLPGGGGGTRADTLPPFAGTGKASRPQGEGQAGATGELDQRVYVPWDRQAGAGELLISGQDTGQGEIEAREREDLLPGAPSQALVPYHQVYYEYLDAANQTLERSYVPSGLKDYVRAYFSQLEP